MLSRMVDGAQRVKIEANSNGRKMEIRSLPSVMTFEGPLTNATRDWGGNVSALPFGIDFRVLNFIR